MSKPVPMDVGNVGVLEQQQTNNQGDDQDGFDTDAVGKGLGKRFDCIGLVRFQIIYRMMIAGGC